MIPELDKEQMSNRLLQGTRFRIRRTQPLINFFNLSGKTDFGELYVH